MSINFVIRGRLGNAIFRYLACSILCIKYNKMYKLSDNGANVSDETFTHLCTQILENEDMTVPTYNLNMNCFYQHDVIYKAYKQKILQFIDDNRDHVVMTDGVLAGDRNYETFKMYDIIHIPEDFNKLYDNVLHIRLEDFVSNNMYIKVERLYKLFDQNIISGNLCIVCKTLNTDFEKCYVNKLTNYLRNLNISVILEHNDVITDYYIMKKAKLLICSLSTLSWCAALLSEDIEKCYFPNYNITDNSSFNRPIDNTFYY